MCNSLHENLVCICAFVEITINIIKHEWKNYRESKSRMDASNEERNTKCKHERRLHHSVAVVSNTLHSIGSFAGDIFYPKWDLFIFDNSQKTGFSRGFEKCIQNCVFTVSLCWSKSKHSNIASAHEAIYSPWLISSCMHFWPFNCTFIFYFGCIQGSI